jgi:PAS domain S-box-containing protein
VNLLDDGIAGTLVLVGTTITHTEVPCPSCLLLTSTLRTASAADRDQSTMDGRRSSGASSFRSDSLERTGMENELSDVVDALPGLVWTALPDGNIDFLNRGWWEYTGQSVAEAIGRGWQAAIHPNDLPELRACWRSMLASGGPGEMEARLRRFDGEYRWFVFRTNPLADVSGQIVKWYGISSDIEDQKRVEKASLERERRFDLILDGLPAHVHILTPVGKPEHVNRQYRDYVGATLEEQQRWETGHVFHPDDRPAALAAWWKSVETGQPYDFEGRRRRADGVYRWFNLRAFPLRDAEGR